MKVLAADGLSFSVPIDSVSKIIEHFKTKGYTFILKVYKSHHHLIGKLIETVVKNNAGELCDLGLV